MQTGFLIQLTAGCYGYLLISVDKAARQLVLVGFNEQPRNSLCVSVGMKAANMGSELLGSL